LSLKIVADEDVDYGIVVNLRKNGYAVVSILEDNRGLSDKDVLDVARNQDSLLLTEDKDFGEWVFAHKEKSVGVVLLRYKIHELEQITDSLMNLLRNHGESLTRKFTVITVKKVRIRKLP
jgi:predicted nuclease of predicted toxin-antitoxin system